jgi:hypothetical protein
VEAPSELIRRLDCFSKKKRIVSVYENTGTVSGKEAEEMQKVAGALHTVVLQWLKKLHPGLL